MCRAAAAGKDARASFDDATETLQDPNNWKAESSEGVWDKVKRTVTGSPATPAEAAQKAANDAFDASKDTANDAINSANKVGFHFKSSNSITQVALLNSKVSMEGPIFWNDNVACAARPVSKRELEMDIISSFMPQC